MYLTNKVLIIDNFYKDPDKVREFALKQTYRDCHDPVMDGNWPGLRTLFLNNLDEQLCAEFRDTLMNNILEGIATQYQCYFETNFQLCYPEHGDSWIHTDVGPWPITHVGVVYLNPNPPENSGTILYKFNDEYTDEFKEYAAKHNNMWTTLTRDKDKEEFHKWFTPTLNVPNVYNRVIMYSPDRWHKSDMYFGSSPETGRLIQPFFANIEYNTKQ